MHTTLKDWKKLQNENMMERIKEHDDVWVFLDSEIQGMVVEASVTHGYVKKYEFDADRSEGPIRKEGKVSIIYHGLAADFVRLEKDGSLYVLFPPEPAKLEDFTADKLKVTRVEDLSTREELEAFIQRWEFIASHGVYPGSPIPGWLEAARAKLAVLG